MPEEQPSDPPRAGKYVTLPAELHVMYVDAYYELRALKARQAGAREGGDVPPVAAPSEVVSFNPEMLPALGVVSPKWIPRGILSPKKTGAPRAEHPPEAP